MAGIARSRHLQEARHLLLARASFKIFPRAAGESDGHTPTTASSSAESEALSEALSKNDAKSAVNSTFVRVLCRPEMFFVFNFRGELYSAVRCA